MTHYDILELSSAASYTEIRSSYRKLAKKFHPDLNPSLEARERIVEITSAYDVLSDPAKKQAYDWQLQGYQEPAVYHPPEYDDREIRKREYIRKKRAQEQKHWEQLFKMKVKFYKTQRYFAFLFLLVALLYSYDYYFTEIRGNYQVQQIGLSRWGDSGVNIGIMSLMTSEKFYRDWSGSPYPSVRLHYSVLHEVPVGMSVEGHGYYKINDTLHSFNNFFSYLLFGIALLLLFKHQYSDWLLTLGMVPFFITAFLFLLTYTIRSGIY